MAFAKTAGARSDDKESALLRNFLRKFGAVAASIPFAEDLLAAYYCVLDGMTPLPVKSALLGAIAYFVLPFDAIPDMLPVLGFTDDAAVLATALKLVSDHMLPEHRQAAKAKLKELSAKN
jgi:uncharacterized membrane protein YkvA (DUF1232 family)